jgi:hypothetical protein
MEMTDEVLKKRFWDCALATTEWNHSAHLRMAWMTLEEHSLDEAHILIRVGIIKLNAAQGLVETPARGYHDTLTRVWLLLVAAAKAQSRGADSAAFLESHSGALSREAPLRHYSRDRLFSVRARAHFVEPDLEPLPHG